MSMTMLRMWWNRILASFSLLGNGQKAVIQRCLIQPTNRRLYASQAFTCSAFRKRTTSIAFSGGSSEEGESIDVGAELPLELAPLALVLEVDFELPWFSTRA